MTLSPVAHGASIGLPPASKKKTFQLPGWSVGVAIPEDVVALTSTWPVVKPLAAGAVYVTAWPEAKPLPEIVSVVLSAPTADGLKTLIALEGLTACSWVAVSLICLSFSTTTKYVVPGVRPLTVLGLPGAA